MKIALVAPLHPLSNVPSLGGVQEMMIDLAHGLIDRGHEVTVFARDHSFSGIPTEVLPVPEKLDEEEPEKAARSLLFSQVNLFLELFLQLEKNYQFDLIHIHARNWSSITYSNLLDKIPIVHTLHTVALTSEANSALRLFHQYRHLPTLTTVSHACAQTYKDIAPIDHIIYNGIDVDRVPFSPSVSSRAPLLFAGRIVTYKGIEEAIEIAERAQHTLLVAGAIEDYTYYNERIVPKIERSDGQIQYLGFLKRQDLWQVMCQSLGLLFPVIWEEPFGLVPIEAMATGTPVIAFRHGAVEEIIDDSETGFIVEDNNIAIAAKQVHSLSSLSRQRCRDHVAEHFSLEAMLNAYEKVYQEAIAKLA